MVFEKILILSSLICFAAFSYQSTPSVKEKSIDSLTKETDAHANETQHRQLTFRNRLANFLGPSVYNNLPVVKNPNFPNLLTTYDSCKSSDGEWGICNLASKCTAHGGRLSGACPLGLSCCVNSAGTCSSSVTYNNTYWHSPTDITSSSNLCSLTINLDQKLPEQRKFRICQVRLDFLLFTIAQPNSETVCQTDKFTVSGATNPPPVICGNNDGQHMYLHVPDSGVTASNIGLTFNFGSGAISSDRRWTIKISMLPCGAYYLAPSDCLQYFTGKSGRIWSFNWADVPITAGTRQLANQDYKICMRTEKFGDQMTTEMCLRPCVTVNGGRSFILTGPTLAPGIIAFDNSLSQGAAATFCIWDYIVIPGGAGAVSVRDRFCGGQLSDETISPTSESICTTARPFRVLYHTNGDETGGAFNGQRDTNGNNVGFCLNYALNI